MDKRVFLIVLDSMGIGGAKDAADYDDEGSDTLRAISTSPRFFIENLRDMGLFNIDDVTCSEGVNSPTAAIMRLCELSVGKDTTIGHWEIAGIVSHKPLPTYPNGFPSEIVAELERRCGRKMLCNKPYSGTEVINKYGLEACQKGALILYTSADSVLQLAAHEEVVPLEELYRCCQIAREIMCGENAVGRIIARPFVGESGSYKRTANRHDYSLLPPCDTMLDKLKIAGFDTIAVGKISDIFAGKGITKSIKTKGNTDGMRVTLDVLDKDFNGLCFVNLVDFDMLYGHRNDVDGYAAALSEFDRWLDAFKLKMRENDYLMITADHGCDPSTPSTDHSRENVPFIIYGAKVNAINLGTISGFDVIADTILNLFDVKANHREIADKIFKNS